MTQVLFFCYVNIKNDIPLKVIWNLDYGICNLINNLPDLIPFKSIVHLEL